MKKITLLFITILLTGCWNYQELNEYAIVTGMAIDWKKDHYEVSFLIANGNKSEDNSTKTSLLTGEGETIYEAIKDISLISPKELYISHLSIVIFSEDVASRGISSVLDFLLRDPQSHQNFYLLLAKDKPAKDVLSILSPLSDYTSQNITSNLINSYKLQAKISDASFNLFMEKYLQPGFEPVMNSITILGDIKEGQTSDSQEKSKQDAYTKLSTIALFKNDQFLGFATEDESIGISLILGEVDTFYFNVPCDDGTVVSVSNNYKVDYEVEKNVLRVKAKSEGTMREVNCKINLEEEKEIQKLETKAEEVLRSYMVKAIQLAKSYQTDIFGFGLKYYQKFPNEFKQIKDWNEFFKNYLIEVEVDFQYTSKGTLEQSLEREKK